MLKKIKNTTILTKLIASFSLIIVIFIAEVIFSSITVAEISRLHNYNNDFMTARSEIILDFHQEFTEMRRLLRESFMNPQWRDSASFSSWRSFEHRLSVSHDRLMDLAASYKASVRADEVFPEIVDDPRITLMVENMEFVNIVYDVFSTNFFQGGNMSFDHGNVLSYTHATENNLQSLRQLVTDNRNTIITDIHSKQNLANTISLVTVFLAIVSAVTMAFLMVKSFTLRIKAIENKAAMVAHGDFSSSFSEDADAPDEISKIFSRLVLVFTKLIHEINETTNENKKGNALARIDEKRFDGGYKEAAVAINALLDSVSTEKEKNENMMFMFDHMPIITTIMDSNLKVIDCNSEVIRKLGISDKQEYISNFAAYSPDYQEDGSHSGEKAYEIYRTAFEHGHIDYEWWHKDHDGNIIPFEVFGIATTFKDEKVLVTYARDITAIKNSQAREKEATERVRVMFESTPLLIEYWNENNQIIDCNSFAMWLFGLESKGEYMQRHNEFYPYFQPGGATSWSYWVKNLEKVFTDGYASFDIVLKGADGRAIYTEVVGIRININNEAVAVTYSKDVTAAKESMEKIKAAEERNKIMLDGNPVACYLIDNNFKILDCNREAVSLFGFSGKEEALAKSKEIFTKNDFEVLWQHYEIALEKGFEKFEWTLNSSNSITFPCDISFVRLSLDDRYVIAAYIYDMTFVKRMLEQREKTQIAEENSRAKSKFLASMSHEIRTPINAVLGISEIQLQNPSLPLDIEEAFAKIYDSAGILLNIINDILDISKIEAGKMDLIINRYEVASLFTDTIQLHLVYLGSKTIKFIVNAQEDMPAFLLGDELRIKQVINNILSNAFKYTDSGSVTLNMLCEYLDNDRKDEDDVNLIISVTDTGRGMTEQQLLALQDEYTRFHEHEDRFTQGTGLGMPIVYNLMNLMNGTISVHSEPGIGTTITLRIPQKISGSELLGKETAENLSCLETGVLSGARKMKFTPESMPYGSVLIVDDVETNIYVARGLMNFYNLQIDSVNGGYAAINKLKEGNVYDIIFMDHMMPDLNGIETTKIIRGLGYTEPIVALTANALIGKAEEFLKNGFDGFLSKPIQTIHLNSVLNKFIRDKQPPEVLAAARAGSNSAGDSGQSIDDFLKSSDLYDTVCEDFVNNQKNVVAEILAALEENDFRTAQRLAHTLKGLAGLLSENTLWDLAEKTEAACKADTLPFEYIGELSSEVDAVLERISRGH